jgi:hypothetical protein
MSPQMNGEPRDGALSTSERETAPISPPSASREAGQPRLRAANTDGVTKTSLTKEDATLTPLFTQEAAMDFRARWDLVQRSFVDNPQEAVQAGDELVAQVIKSLTATFSSQRSELDNELNQTDPSSTENLRLALRRYRSFFERLLSI